jgi:DegV family protein with EDD domain
MNIRIVTDSTCDLPDQVIRELGITVLPLNIHIGEKAYLDGVDLSHEEFYRQLPALNPFPKTASPSPASFERLYQRLAEEGAQAILSIHLSESLSATVNEARIAAGHLAHLPITVLDSGQLSLGLGFLVEKAARLALAGGSLAEILSVLDGQMRRTHVFASLTTLEYLRRSGRMHTAVARLGEFFKIKPLLNMSLGNPIIRRARTQKNATAQLMNWLEQYAPFERLAIVHAGAEAEAQALHASVRAYWPESAVLILPITPVLGAHLGIGALGFACISKE